MQKFNFDKKDVETKGFDGVLEVLRKNGLEVRCAVLEDKKNGGTFNSISFNIGNKSYFIINYSFTKEILKVETLGIRKYNKFVKENFGDYKFI